MSILTRRTGVWLVASCSLMAGCVSNDPVAYSGLASSSQLRPNVQDKTGRVPYQYQEPVDWRSYHAVMVSPVAVYRGPDNQFGSLSEQNRAVLANYMQSEFTKKLRTRYSIANSPAPGTLRVQLTLTGAKANTPILGTFSRIDLLGGPYNAVQAARGREGTLTGSVNYAVEIYDAATNRLLKAYVSKQYPGALNLGASITPMQASKVGVDKGADALIAQMN